MDFNRLVELSSFISDNWFHWSATPSKSSVRHEQSPGSFRVEDKPFTSDLSGQDFWTLLNAGYRPVETAP